MSIKKRDKIQEVWQEIEEWLGENFPQFLTYLNPPATLLEIEQVERELNIQFTDEVKKSYLLHNGSTNWLFDGNDFLSLSEVIDFHNENIIRYQERYLKKDMAINSDSASSEKIKKEIWNPRWIPILAESNMFLHFLDLDPTENGIHGQIIFVNDDYHDLFFISDNFTMLMEEFLNDLRTGNYEISSNGRYLDKKEISTIV